jgi:hypothetical protein
MKGDGLFRVAVSSGTRRQFRVQAGEKRKVGHAVEHWSRVEKGCVGREEQKVQDGRRVVLFCVEKTGNRKGAARRDGETGQKKKRTQRKER